MWAGQVQYLDSTIGDIWHPAKIYKRGSNVWIKLSDYHLPMEINWSKGAWNVNIIC